MRNKLPLCPVRLIFDISVLVSNLEEFQECWFGGARLPHDCHRSAEVIHILAIGVQHHGLGELHINTGVTYCIMCFSYRK